MKHIFLAVSLMFSSVILAQDYKEEFEKYFPEDTLKQYEILEAWEKANSNDAELYYAYFLYFFNKSKKEITTSIEDENLAISDSLEQTEEYVLLDSPNYYYHYNEEFFQKAMEKIDKGIELFPNRLDFRLLKILGLENREYWQSSAKEIVKTVRYSKINNNQWIWIDNQKISGGENEFLSAIEIHQKELPYDENYKMVACEILKIYPNNAKNLSNLAGFYLVSKKYDKGIKILKKAKKIDPKNCDIMMQIAYAYEQKGDKANAIKYYEKTIKNGNKYEKLAKRKIEELKKK